MQQKRIMPDRTEKIWTADIEALRESMPNLEWLKQDRLLERDLQQMAEFLPHWLLTVGSNSEPLRSKCCKDNVAPINGGLRCILCDSVVKERANSLMWTGLLPINLEGRDKAARKIEDARSNGKLHCPIIAPGGKRHLLVPVVVAYPVNWPYSPPTAYYANREYINALNLKGSSHNIHVVGDRQLCLYHGSQWNDNTTVMQVIANRIAPHAFALLRIANGEESIEYFVTDYSYDR